MVKYLTRPIISYLLFKKLFEKKFNYEIYKTLKHNNYNLKRDFLKRKISKKYKIFEIKQTLHGICFARVSDAITKNEQIVTIEEFLKTRVNWSHEKVFLGYLGLKNVWEVVERVHDVLNTLFASIDRILWWYEWYTSFGNETIEFLCKQKKKEYILL